MKIAFVFDWYHRDTVGSYLLRAAKALGHEAEHFWLRNARQIPPGFDLYLRVDFGDYTEKDLATSLNPAAFYAIDSHIPKSWQKILRLAPRYGMVFCAQRWAAERLPNGRWLPLGCDAELHAGEPAEPEYDVAFVGSDGGVPRKFILQALRERYPKSRIGPAPHTEIASLYNRARVVFNYSIADDVNMRVFEALAAGACLVTNALSHDDLKCLGLKEEEHLVLYRSPREIFAKIDDLLAQPERRLKIGRAGQEVVMNKHTYVQRIEEIVRIACAPL
ncbi:MAG: glycosyltransferase family 1 protein [Candidatus Omnitrophica bacterium]|nr:glycosyltransferase family 1 protein [Candidatus Omnitrophota bacterium]